MFAEFLEQYYLALPWVPRLSNIWFLITQQVLGMGSILWNGSEKMPDIVGYVHELCATVVLENYLQKNEIKDS